MAEDERNDRIAIIGMAGRLPGAAGLEELWRNLAGGVESVTFFSPEELLAAGVDRRLVESPRYVRAQGRLADIDLFDAAFFGFSPREAEMTDPQHRLFLEASWHALEDAGYDPAIYSGAAGVFASASANLYLYQLYSRPEIVERMGDFRAHIANGREFLPTWVSFKLNLRGPSINVQTACSSSLVAVHLACQSLLNGESDLAIAGGVAIRHFTPGGYLYQDGAILSPDGRCRAFDAQAGGTVSGDGIGVVVLKRLPEALADGDHIHAVVLGSAVNNDGWSKVGFTAPSLEGQTRVISEALAVAGVDPATIGYVEAHGTGTPLGDPIEISALTDAFRAKTAARGYCGVGSVKTNIGHLDAAAGIAGLLKAVLALQHREVPPSLHFTAPNPDIDFARSPFYVNSRLAEWPAGSTPRRAGVSSFGIGGTNAHVVLEEAPARPAGDPSSPWQLLVWSARTAPALAAMAAGLGRALEEGSELDLADVAFTLQCGRRAFVHRAALVSRDLTDAAQALSKGGDRRRVLSDSEPGSRQLAFLLPGQGEQRVGMGRELYLQVPAFRAEVDLCAELLSPHLDHDLRDVLYPADDRQTMDAERRLEQTAWAQPAMFVFTYALARLWISWGVKPQALLGHSLGELVAACLAGVLDLEDALALVAARGRLMQALPAGGMLALPLAEEEVLPLLGGSLGLAAVNGPRRTVVSGSREALDDLERRLAGRGIEGRRLRTSHAFHSAMMDPALPLFADIVGRVRLRAPQIPYLSNLTGDWITDPEATHPGVWARQLRETVRFGAGLDRLLAGGPWLLLEIGPRPILSGMARRHPRIHGGHAVVSSLEHPDTNGGERAALLQALGRVWVAGAEVDWVELWRGERRHRVPLPVYPFERKRYWNGPGPGAAVIPAPSGAGAVADIPAAAEAVFVDEETSMPEPSVVPQPTTSWREQILRALWEMVHDLSGTQAVEIDETSSFLEIGVDSLLLIQVGQWLEKRFQVKVSLVQLLEELTSIAAVADHLERELTLEKLRELFPRAVQGQPPEAPPAFAARPPAPVAPAEVSPASREPAPPLPFRAAPSVVSTPPDAVAAATLPQPQVPTSTVERILMEQMHLLAQQLQLLGGAGPMAAAAPEPRLAAPEAPLPVSEPRPVPGAQPTEPAAAYTRFGPYRPLEVGPKGGLSPRQQAYLDEFIARYTARTPGSKALTQQYRPVLADSRASFGFRRLWKEMIYPIHGQSSRGSRIWDVDGNEYVDICMGFGLHLFGHSPGFVVEAMERQMRQGLELGPQSALAGRVAELICELTGMERAVFCNSGTEAVMGALRVARTYTRRSKIAMFSGSYHGWFDGTLARTQRVEGQSVSMAVAPGVSPEALRDVMVLEFDSPESLDRLAAHGEELAAVLVEPVRSRDPGHQPREFLRQVRELTARSGTVLIFDEMVTGFRIHPGGAQSWYGIEADLATYGKLIAAGLPIGVVAGRSRFMDVLDGGPWSFGDDSYPPAEKTMFAGAFFKHPLTMAASLAVLERLQREGPQLQERLGERTTGMAARLNAFFRAADVGIEIASCGPLFRFTFPRELQQYADLFSYNLIEKGVFYGVESGNCFLTPAHSETDVERVETVVRQSVEELQGGGFLPGGSGTPPRGGHRSEPRQAPATTGRAAVLAGPAPGAVPAALRARPIDFSLYYFGSYEGAYDPGKYDLLFEGVRFADEHGFTAVWLPERHFHSFGGLSPNPAVVAAALASSTRRIQLRAGSVVLPLHHPLRVAEEWSVVDNLSHGRVGVAFASGWHADDFVFAPDAYEQRRAVMYDGIERVRSFWRGEAARVRNGEGKEIAATLHPLPRQRELPVWLTAASESTYRRAGEMGFGVLTNLQTQSLDELARKLEIYREALARHGRDPATGKVAVLLHTLIDTDLDEARRKAAGPLRAYLRSSFALTRKLVEARGQDIDFEKLPPAELDYLLARASERYMTEHALIGTPESCLPLLDRMAAIGVTEIGCLIDFGVDTPSMLASLPSLAELKQRLESRAATSEPPAARELPMLEAQRSVWLAARIGTEAARGYNEAVVLRLRGPLDPLALRAALQRVVDRHAALRSTFSPDGVWQRIAPLATAELPLIDFSRLGDWEREKQVTAWLAQQVRAPFDLERGPLLRCGLARMGKEEHYLCILPYHLILDGHSTGVLLQELGLFYAAARRGEPCFLEDVAQREEQVRRAAVEQEIAQLGDAEAYWTGVFAGELPQLALPTDRPRPRIAGYAGALRSRLLGEDLTRELRRLAPRQGATLFMTLLAAYGVLLRRLTGQDDVVVGVASQDPAASGAVMGYFLNLLPLRLRSDGDPTFPELLTQARRHLIAAQAYRFYTLAQLLRKLTPSRAPGRSMVDTTLNLDRGAEGPRFLDLESELVRVHPGAIMVDLRFNLTEVGAGLLLECHYRSELFEATTAERFMASFEALLESLVARPESRASELDLLTARERHQLLVSWNDTASSLSEVTVHQLFAEQAERTPEAEAVLCGGHVLTYSELDDQTNRLARHLRRRGIGLGARVGVLLERSPEMMVALLGVLKAGAAYVPLDPADPAARLALVAESAGLALLLTQEGLASALPLPAAGVLPLEAEQAAIAAERASPLETPVDADHLAYVIYTSGSTGVPKGVQISHRALSNLLLSMREQPGLGPEDRLLAVTTLSFDIAALELYLPLLVGGCVVVATREESLDGRRLADLLTATEATAMQATPATWRLLFEAGWSGQDGVRAFCGGEALPWPLAERLCGAVDGLWNLYGPTETTVWSACGRVKAQDGAVSLGRPIGNTRAYLLGRDLEPLPMGVEGDLYLSGRGLSWGYLGRPELTAESFLPDPFAATPGERLYRTGDRARYLPDGRLGFHGRSDHQIKLHGFRIELGEVEAALVAEPGVQEAAVVACDDGEERSLVAFAVPVPGASLSVAALREGLGRRLPQHMVPGSFVLSASLPRTPNNKVDRRALARLDPAAERMAARAYAPPRNVTELALVQLWEELLEARPIGVEDSFFELGGHSLVANRLALRVRESFGVEFRLQEIFAEPTIAGLARRIVAAMASGSPGAQRPALQRVPRDGDLPLSFAQQRLWVLDRLEPGDTAYNMATAVRLSGALDRPVLARALAEVVRRHESLRTTFAIAEGDPVQVIADSGPEGLPLVDLRGLPGPRRQDETERLARAAARRPFDLAVGPLLRAALVAREDEEHVFLLTMHHIVADAWSIGVLIRELSALYGSFARHAVSPLPELPIQYADFAAWQRSWLREETLAAELAFWRELMAGVPPFLELPADRPRPSLRSSAGASRSFALAGDLLAGLRELSRREGVTLFMTLLAAFQTLLARHSGQPRLCVGIPVAGRNHLATEDLIGIFVNTLVLPAEVVGERSFADLVAQIRKTALAAYAHQDLPFERLVEELQPERDLSGTPLFQVMLVLLNVPSAPLAAPGLCLEPLSVDPGTERFDLTLSLTESADRLGGALSYRIDLFDGATIERLGAHFQVLLAAVAAAPDQPLFRLPLLTEAERHQLLISWNDRASSLPERTVHQLFAEQAGRTPEAEAVVCGEHTLTYSELDGQSNRLARHLRHRGIAPGARVGVLLERSPEMVVALLGVLKAGAAYVPLDPSYPAARLALVAESAGLALLLTQEGLASLLPLPAGRVLRLEAEQAVIAAERAAPLETPVDADHLVYIIYTSGSTGVPKGVQISHRSLSNFLLSMREQPGFGPEDRLLAVTTLAFDITAMDLYLPLLAGGCVVVATREESLDGRRLADLLAATRATVLQATPATWRLLFEAGWSGQDRLRAFCGGEALPWPLAERLCGAVDGLWNLYGPTETTVWSACGRVKAEDGAVSLGRPIGNVRAYLLGRDLEPLPMGVEGDLYLGGRGLSWGYLGRPELTAESFIPDLFAATPGERLYRTGDRARYLPDGRLGFHGRSDHQIKLRGFRIELGEIEAALMAEPGVQEAVVVARDDGEERSLVAFAVPAPGASLSVAALREGLGRRLPRYMVPGSFVLSASLPRTPNNKVDRRALARLGPAAERTAARAYAPPRSVTELALVQLWEELLEARPIGVEDSFFELGGHSLLAVRLMMRIKRRWGQDLPQSALFEQPTVRGLARRIEDRDGEPSWSPLVAIQPRGSQPPLFFVHPIGGGVLCFYDLAQQMGPDQPFHAFQATSLAVGGGALSSSIEAMACEYVAALRSSHPTGPYRIGGWSFGGLVAFEMAQQLFREGEEVALLMILDTDRPLGRSGPDLDSAAWVSLLTREHARQNGRELTLSADELRGLPLEEQLSTAIERLRELLDVEDMGVDVPTLVRLIEGHRARRRAFENYHPTAYPGRIALFRPYETDAELLEELSEEQRRQREDPTLGWGELAPGRVRVQYVPGYHETLALAPHAAALAAALRDRLTDLGGEEDAPPPVANKTAAVLLPVIHGVAS